MGLFSSQISTKRMVPLCRQLATADQAGLPITRSLELVAREMKDPQVRDVLNQMNARIKGGATLAEAAREQSKHLPRFFVELLATGERGGRLDIMLRELADYYEDRQTIQRRAVNAMILPFLELGAAWFLGTFAFMIVNRLLAMFASRSGGSRFDFMSFFRDYALFQGKAMLVVATVFAVCVILSRLGLFKWVWGYAATYIWPMSMVTRSFGMARFFRSMSLLMTAGLNIVRCVENSAAVMVNPYLERDMLKAIPFIKQGMTLHEAFAGSKFMPRMNLEMMAIGEQAGELEAMMRKAAEYNLERGSTAVNRLITVLTTLIILGVALLIGAIIIMFYVRLYGGLMNEIGV